jgi:anaerobic ribonucleoside-triphosphate reductase activating protein
MLIYQVFAPLKTLGPGERIGIWTQGCSHGCKGCMSKDTWDFDNNKSMSIENIIGLVEPYIPYINSVTISGGDPFMQADFYELLLALREKGIKDILVYTGYKLEYLLNSKNEKWLKSLELIDVLIDGLYIEALNDDKPLRGSSNQTIHFLKPDFKYKYEELLENPRKFQLLIQDSQLSIFGIPTKNYLNRIANLVKIK